MNKPIYLTQKEIDRKDGDYTVVVRKQPRGTIKVMAVRVDGTMGYPLSHGGTFSEEVTTKEAVPSAVREVCRWLSKMGYPSKMAHSARMRGKSHRSAAMLVQGRAPGRRHAI